MTRSLRWIGFLATALIVALLIVNILREPGRQEAAQTAYRATAVARGIDLYAQHCVNCHGAAGEGLGLYRALNQEFVRGQDARLLFNTVERGRYGTDMAAFGGNDGGPLTHAQIDALVALVQYGSWAAVEARVAALGLTPTEADVLAAMPAQLETIFSAVSDLEADQAVPLALDLFAANCAECHGEAGEGTLNAPQLNNAYVRGLPEAQLFELVTLGVRNTQMEGFQDRLSSDEIAALVYLLRHWGTLGSGEAVAAGAGSVAAVEGEVAGNGQELFETWCAVCHGLRGEGGAIAPSLNDIPALSAEFIFSRARGGKNAMPPFPEANLPDAELRGIIVYAREHILGSALPVFSAEELAAGRDLYLLHCGECHGPYGEGTDQDGPRLNTSPPMRAVEIVNFTRVGSAQTPAIPPSQVSDEDLRLIVAYLHSLAEFGE